MWGHQVVQKLNDHYVTNSHISSLRDVEEFHESQVYFNASETLVRFSRSFFVQEAMSVCGAPPFHSPEKVAL